MGGHDILVIGASAGGVEALHTLIAALPADLPAAVFVVQHVSPDAPDVLPRILGRADTLPIMHPLDGQCFERGRVYVAPPDHHLVVKRTMVRVVHGPRENRLRPAVDPLFRSAAAAFGPRVVGVMLTGELDDGTAGLLEIKRQGGIALVQDPAEAHSSGMPSSAARHVAVDEILPLRALAPALVRLAQDTSAVYKGETMEEKLDIAELDVAALSRMEVPGELSVFTCPECNGPLWEQQDGDFLHYRCHLGHALTAQHLMVAQAEQVEEAFWRAERALEAQVAMAQRLARLAQSVGDSGSVAPEAIRMATLRRERLLWHLLRADQPVVLFPEGGLGKAVDRGQ